MPPKSVPTKKAKIENANKSAKKTTKKWSQTQNRESLSNAVMFDKTTLEKLKQEVPKYKLITPSIISDRLKIAVSLAANGLKELCRQKQIKLVSCTNRLRVYTRNAQAE